jgi:hypothetical protein
VLNDKTPALPMQCGRLVFYLAVMSSLGKSAKADCVPL